MTPAKLDEVAEHTGGRIVYKAIHIHLALGALGL
jgi:hypothetical protein